MLAGSVYQPVVIVQGDASALPCPIVILIVVPKRYARLQVITAYPLPHVGREGRVRAHPQPANIGSWD